LRRRRRLLFSLNSLRSAFNWRRGKLPD